MKEWNRNKSKIEELDGEKIVSKEHQKLIFLKREELFYSLFQDNPIIKTPKVHSVKGLNLKTFFIKGEEKNIYQAVKDWAGVHSYFLNNCPKEDKLLIRHNINEVSSYLLRHKDILNSFGISIKNRLQDIGLNKEVETILHGDLTRKNFITLNGENYYFDFELGGMGHPARDIASMVISNPEQKGGLIDSYKTHSKNDYKHIGEDVDNWTITRAAQLYFIFDKREGTEDQKKGVKNRLVGILEEVV